MAMTTNIVSLAKKRKEKKMAAREDAKETVSLTDVKSKFKAPEGMNFRDISAEKFRVYVFDSGAKVTINNPVYLNVSKNGGHRVFDASGVSHYIPYKWIHLYWEPRDGKPNFVL